MRLVSPRILHAVEIGNVPRFRFSRVYSCAQYFYANEELKLVQCLLTFITHQVIRSYTISLFFCHFRVRARCYNCWKPKGGDVNLAG